MFFFVLLAFHLGVSILCVLNGFTCKDNISNLSLNDRPEFRVLVFIVAQIHIRLKEEKTPISIYFIICIPIVYMASTAFMFLLIFFIVADALWAILFVQKINIPRNKSGANLIGLSDRLKFWFLCAI